MCAVNRGAVQHTHAEAKPPGNVLQMRANAAPQQIKYVECTKFVRLTHNKNPVRQVHARPGDEEMDTEGDALSGVSRKHSMRSSSCWFTEFCKSQCLSHFAAPFIVVRAETSVAENCIAKEGRGCTDRGSKYFKENGNRNKEHPVLLPSSPTIRKALSLSNSQSKVQGRQKRLCVNDPSAGSPTETLLRLLLPLSDKVH